MLVVAFSAWQPAICQTTLKTPKLITTPSAVIINPSDRLIKKMKKENAGDSYDTIVDDDVYYMDQCKQYLESVKANKIYRESEGVARFKTIGGKIYTMPLDSYFFGILLFNGKDKPIVASLTDLKEDYEKYMKK